MITYYDTVFECNYKLLMVQNNLFDLHTAIAAHQEFLRTEAIPDNHIFFEGLLYLTDKKRLMILTGS